jgi:hypothetical protein
LQLTTSVPNSSRLAPSDGAVYLVPSLTFDGPTAKPMHIPAAIKSHKLVTAGVVVVVLPIVVFTLWVVIAFSFSYSSGHRAGFLQKFSRRGWLCKTWEGEIQLTALPGAAPEIFAFSVRSDSIAQELNKYVGQRVDLHYRQHKGVPTSCFGDTEYFIDGVRAVGPISP